MSNALSTCFWIWIGFFDDDFDGAGFWFSTFEVDSRICVVDAGEEKSKNLICILRYLMKISWFYRRIALDKKNTV